VQAQIEKNLFTGKSLGRYKPILISEQKSNHYVNGYHLRTPTCKYIAQ